MNGVVDGLDPLVSFMKEKLCWKILRWLNWDKVHGGNVGLPADPGRFDLPRPVYSREMCSFHDVLSPSSNVDGGAEERAEGDATAAFPTLSCGPNLSLAGDLENQGAR